ncbi:MAG: hypothetical protein P1U81_01210 [Verrucomicrobiales bacterium]|nr:hypothetical protein [Verrucomicrobiales bacterium]
MKKLIALTAVITASFFLLAPTSAEAGSYRSKVIGKCGGCGGHIHSFYRPVRLPCGNIRYTWVPSYHSNCGRVSSYRSISRFPSSSYVRRSYVPGTHGFVSRSFYSRGPGISLRFGSSRGYCR